MTMPHSAQDVTPAGTCDAAEAEHALVEGVRAGDAAACELFVRRHSPQMFALAKRLLRDDAKAQDAVQDAFLSAFRSIELFRGNARLGTWLHRITVNACLMQLRRAKRHPEVAIDDVLPAFDATGHHVEPMRAWPLPADRAIYQREIGEALRQCLGCLPETYSTVVILRDVEELSTEEAAMRLGISVNAVKLRLHRARQALRALMAARFASPAAHPAGAHVAVRSVSHTAGFAPAR